MAQLAEQGTNQQHVGLATNLLKHRQPAEQQTNLKRSRQLVEVHAEQGTNKNSSYTGWILFEQK